MSDFPKTTRFTAATKLACAIAGTNPDRFNEAIHAGFYPCAPATTPGRARSFDVNDVIALRLFQRFVDGGMSAKMAGHKACSVRDFLRQHPDADQVYIVKTAFDDGDADKGQYREGYLLPDFDTKKQHADFLGKQAPDVVSVEVHNFHYLRGRIVHEIERAALNVGGYRGVKELAWAGCDDDEIAAYSGHSTKEMIAKYAGEARQEMRARQAREKRQ